MARDLSGAIGAPATVFSAPGRVNVIGEHTDYNEGWVMPSAIGLRTRVTTSSRPEHRLRVESREFPGVFDFDLEHLPERATGEWCDYVLGVATTLRQAGHALAGASLSVDSEIPIGAGLSSSAALEVATALALTSSGEEPLPLAEVARLCQHAENAFIGARVGIMDQFVACLGRAGHALLLDCRSLAFELIPIPERVRMVVCNTMVKHQHATGEYNRRRDECEAAVRLLTHWYPDIRALRDVSSDQLMRHAGDLPELLLKRCRHVVEENERVQDGARCLRAGDVERLGDLMRASHRSLRDLYEVSCRELDIMVDVAEGLPGYYGGRMIGGGFGGCTLHLVEAAHADAFAGRIARRFHRATGVEPAVYVCAAADGVRAESVP